jgi:uncharacterized membrane protein YdjX (TVP38/TMEM64 family)
VSYYSYAKQVRAVLIFEAVILAGLGLISYFFWRQVCDDTLQSCLADGTTAKVFTFLMLSFIRPLVFTPILFVNVLAGDAFGPYWGTLLNAIGSVTSGLLVWGLAKLLGRRLAKPWLKSNLPATFKFVHSQDYKLVFATRLLPFIPFDVLSFVYGALDFRLKSVAIATFFGSLPESYLVAKLTDPTETVLSATANSLAIIGATVILPLVAYEFFQRKRGSGMWVLLKAMYREIHYEVHVNNDIVRRQVYDPSKTPVLLLYGFFSSRRAVTVLERMLTTRGYQVLSFNLGGMLGTFFTRDILETANFIDYKIKRQIERHGFKQIHIVAHSKGGLVALWWVLKLGGHRYCKNVITMGTPFGGTPLTYLALVTPLGFLWRDMGQMRPGSSFLRSLHDVDIPSDVKITCIHSTKDRVSRGDMGLFKPRRGNEKAHSVPMDHISHFEFLYRRDVGDMIASVLNSSDDRKNSEAS